MSLHLIPSAPAMAMALGLRRALGTALLALALLPAVTHGDILLDKIIVEFAHDQPPREDIYVINNGDDNAFVKVEVLAVDNPGEDEEKRISLAGAEDLPFIASPARIVIPPGGRKQVRLVNLKGPAAVEQVYRINFTPVLPPLEEQQGATVRVVVAYQVLAIVHPARANENLQVTRSANALKFVNAGNSYVMLSEGQQCDEKNEECVDLPSRRLYAGNQWTIALPYTTPARFSLTSFKGAREAKF